MTLVIRPLLNPYENVDNFDLNLQSMKFDSLIAVFPCIKEEGDINDSEAALKTALGTFSHKFPGIFRPLLPGDFLSVTDGKEVRLYRITPNDNDFQQWHRQGSLV